MYLRHSHHTTTRIDVFAVRQWPGNEADLDFRGVLKGCAATIVAAAPIQGTLSENGKAVDKYGIIWGMSNPDTRKAFLKSPEYAAAAKILPFCRLWYACVVPLPLPSVRHATGLPYPSTNLNCLAPTTS